MINIEQQTIQRTEIQQVDPLPKVSNWIDYSGWFALIIPAIIIWYFKTLITHKFNKRFESWKIKEQNKD